MPKLLRHAGLEPKPRGPAHSSLVQVSHGSARWIETNTKNNILVSAQVRGSAKLGDTVNLLSPPGSRAHAVMWQNVAASIQQKIVVVAETVALSNSQQVRPKLWWMLRGCQPRDRPLAESSSLSS
jgi:hypothetical protein